jgi:hypothetical protein
MGIVDLENIFQIQNELADYIKKNHSEFWDESKQPFEGYRKFMLSSAIIQECVEYKHDLKFKWWKDKDNYKIDENNRRKVEIPDILHFFIQLCIEDGVSAQDLYQTYLDKIEENKNRQDRKY